MFTKIFEIIAGILGLVAGGLFLKNKKQETVIAEQKIEIMKKEAEAESVKSKIEAVKKEAEAKLEIKDFEGELTKTEIKKTTKTYEKIDQIKDAVNSTPEDQKFKVKL